MRKRKDVYDAWSGVLTLGIEVEDVGTEEQEPHEPTKRAFLKALQTLKKQFEQAHPGYKILFEGRGPSYYDDRIRGL